MTLMPKVEGVLTADEVYATGAAIVGMQEDSGALPWFPGGQTDPWDHVESAMALSVTGFHAEAEAAYEWSRRTQRDDGSWPIRTVCGVVEDDGVDSNFCAYIAVGVWHHYLITGDTRFLRRMWPTVCAALNLVVRYQRADGAIRWGGDHHTGEMFSEALITGNASMYQSLDCGIRIGVELGERGVTELGERGGTELGAPDDTLARWDDTHRRLGAAFEAGVSDEKRYVFADDPFEPPAENSMDWYYPVLTGAVRGPAGAELIRRRWDEFVVPGRGVRCVDHRPWVTGAETSELALAMDAIGETVDAISLLASIQHLRDPDGSYWTGLVFADGKRWPVEKSCWTSAAVILAADAVSRTSAGNGIFRDVHERIAVDR